MVKSFVEIASPQTLMWQGSKITFDQLVGFVLARMRMSHLY